jgi:diguanylate cyclase (GGDEF)-like protein
MTGMGVILAVDDTLASLKLLTSILAAAGYLVRPANSGELALASLAASPPELILLDIHMPGMDGFEVLRRIKAREESRNIPVIFLSASVDLDRRVEGLRLGAVDFVSKPFHTEELLARVQTHLELRRMRSRLQQQTADLRQANEQLQEEITERKRAEEDLRTAKVAVERANDGLQAGMEREARLARTDPLTGVSNRLHLFEYAAHEFAVARRYQRPLSVAMLDLDRFKPVNDRLGHAAGDQMLVLVAEAIRVGLRGADLVARYGGEEFVALLPATDCPQARIAAQRICERVATVVVESGGGQARVTASIGVATVRTDDASIEAAIQRADEAMYAAKQAGRNRVVARD